VFVRERIKAQGGNTHASFNTIKSHNIFTTMLFTIIYSEWFIRARIFSEGTKLREIAGSKQLLQDRIRTASTPDNSQDRQAHVSRRSL